MGIFFIDKMRKYLYSTKNSKANKMKYLNDDPIWTLLVLIRTGIYCLLPLGLLLVMYGDYSEHKNGKIVFKSNSMGVGYTIFVDTNKDDVSDKKILVYPSPYGSTYLEEKNPHIKIQ